MIRMIKQEYKYSAITEKIIGCAMKVHSTLGNGFQEVIYQRALAIERQIAATDKKIDELVYQLYGLTEEEIKMVEGK